jgi:hypothetical protein
VAGGKSRPPPIEPEGLPRVRAASQLLQRPVAMRDPVELARAIAGAQAQDIYAGPLSFRSRSRRLTAADVERARTEECSLLRTWVMRMTIHLIPADDAGWMLPLFEPGIEAWSRRRLEQFGMPRQRQDKALKAIERALTEEGPLTRPEAAERVVAAGIELKRETRLHVAMLAVTSGISCLGPDRGASSCLVLRHDWLAEPPRFDREAALAELSRRYLGAFGPASERDFAYWSGLALGEVRTGLGQISAEIEESDLGGETLLTLKKGRRRLPPPGVVRMLGAFDTYMLGYRDRGFAVTAAEDAAVIKEGGGGWIWPVIVQDGTVIGGWRSKRSKGGLEVELRPLRRFDDTVRTAIEAEIEDIARFEAKPVKLVDSLPG